MTQGELGKMAYEEFVKQGGWRGLGVLLPRAWEEVDQFSQGVWMMIATKIFHEAQRQLVLQQNESKIHCSVV